VSRLALSLLAGLSLALPFVTVASAAPDDRFGAEITPAAVQPLSSSGYAITLANRNNSTSAANNAHVVVPAGFVVSTLSAVTSASGSCTASTWAVALNAATSTIDAVAPTGAANELCPGATLRITFNATAPAAETDYTWTTTLLRDTSPFSLQGSQPRVRVDATAAAPVIASGPPSPSNSSSATFAFSYSDPAAAFRCQLDGTPFAACTSPASYTGLAQGPHAFAVKAIDLAGNESATALRAWTIDLTPPPAPAILQKPPTVTASTSASFSFTDAEASLTYLCKLDAAAFSGCTSPLSYPGPLAAGPHQFQVKARDAAGNESAAVPYGWTIDLTNPVVTIDPATQPADPTNQRSVSFAFTSNKAGSTFSCRLDDAGFSPCTSPAAYAGLGDRRHRFAVRATDPAGNTGLATVWEWTLDTIAPVAPSIGSAPRNPTNVRNASITFSSTEPGLGYACRLDGGAFAACTSPVSYPGLADGAHAFAVRARDAAGNVGPASVRTWVTDTVAPRTMIKSNPLAVSSSASGSFGFSSNEALSSFTCSLDGSGYAACSSPRAYAALADGTHTFRVRATDAAGNSDPSPPSYSWKVMAPPGTIKGLTRTVGYGSLKLTWSLPTDNDFDHVQVSRSRRPAGGTETVVYEGTGRSYVDKRFKNGTYYGYKIRTYDRSGNASPPVPLAVPPGVMLRSPVDRAVVNAPPTLSWVKVPRATYYNVQLYRGGRKLLSLWPNRARLKLQRGWTYKGRRVELRKGTYTWWVWPGFGPRVKGTYGQLLGTATFVVR